MARAKRKKQTGIDINVAVVIMILISILLAILIYTKSGYIGEHLSPMLGGIMGVIKYIIPIGTFIIALYMTYQDKDYLFSKLVQYGIFLLCIATILSVSQISKGNIDINNDFSKVVEDGYYLGEKNIGGGAIRNSYGKSSNWYAWRIWNCYFVYWNIYFNTCIYVWNKTSGNNFRYFNVNT